MEPFVLLHLSDLHVSTYGDTFHTRSLVRRGAAPVEVQATRALGRRVQGPPAPRYEPVWAESGWRVLRDLGRKGAPVILDPEGYAHAAPAPKGRPGPADPIERAIHSARALHERSAGVLGRTPPSERRLQELLQDTPANTNLRLLYAARALPPADVVLLTGDLTDDGYGYELIEGAFAPYREQGRLLAIPGNHDLYLFPISGSGRPRPTHASKRTSWQAFAGRLGLALDPCGAWARAFPEAGVIIAGLDSCARPQPRFYRQNGGIGAAQIAFLRQLSQTPSWQAARHRVVAFHHHLVPLAHGVGGRTPTEIGMRLDDAREVATVLNEIGATFVLHGHRHISEERHPAGCHFRLLAAPSLTLGCKSGAGPSGWRVELGERAHISRVNVGVPAVPQLPDPTG